MAVHRLQCLCGWPNGVFYQRGSLCTAKILKSLTKRFSATAAVQEEAANTEIIKPVTSPNSVLSLGNEDLGLFHLITHNDVRTKLPHGIHKKLARLWEALGENGMMVRKPFLELRNHLQSEEGEGPPKKYMLYGPRFSGKTTILCQAVLYGTFNKWVTVHVPYDLRITNNISSLQASTWNSKRLDQPEIAAKWLKDFRSVNAHLLDNVKTHQQYHWGKREMTEKDSSLLDVVNQGLSRSSYTTDAVGVVLRELRMQTSHKVMVAMDSVNTLFENTRLKDEEKEWVPVDQLNLANQFKKLLNPTHGIHQGVYVLACSLTASVRSPQRHWDYKDVFSEENLDFLGPVTPVLVPSFSREEARHLFEYYKAKGWMNAEITDRLMDEAMFLSGGNALDLYELSVML